MKSNTIWWTKYRLCLLCWIMIFVLAHPVIMYALVLVLRTPYPWLPHSVRSIDVMILNFLQGPFALLLAVFIGIAAWYALRRALRDLSTRTLLISSALAGLTAFLVLAFIALSLLHRGKKFKVIETSMAFTRQSQLDRPMS